MGNAGPTLLQSSLNGQNHTNVGRAHLHTALARLMIAEEDIDAVLLVASGFIDFTVDGFHELDEGKRIAKRTAGGSICQFRVQ